MIRLPWVARLAYDNAVAALDKAEARVDSLTESIIRIQRAEHGLSEVPREPRKVPETMPAELRAYLAAIPTKGIQREARNQMYREYMEIGDWAPIIAKTYAPQETEEDG